jgi:predicted metal-binding membrane protein
MELPETDRPASESRGSAIEQILRRDDLIVGFCIVALVLLAWWWLFRTADVGMGAHAGASAMPDMGRGAPVWTWTYLSSAFAMWVLMMVAMMLPSAAPMILLFARLSGKYGQGSARTVAFASCYLLIWILFSALASVSQAALVSMAFASDGALRLVDGKIAGLLMLMAGAYQLSPLKAACLDYCRSPLAFLMQGWRPGWRGAARIGLRHGLYCLGCCWALMLLLFVAGVMNLAWIGALTIVVLAEKLAPPSIWVRQGLALGLMLGGVLMIVGR